MNSSRNNFGIRFLCHNIPNVLSANFNWILGFRIQNTSERVLYFHSHSSFYSTVTNDKNLKISILRDGSFVANALVYNDCIDHGQCETIFFPFHTGDEGECHLQIAVTEHRYELPVYRSGIIFSRIIRVKRNSFTTYLKRKLIYGWFDFLYSELPLILKRLQYRYNKAIYYYFSQNNGSGKTNIEQLKSINRQVAFREKQVRKLKLNSLPSYIGIDTTLRCNLKCKSCFRNHLKIDLNSKSDMPDYILNQLIQELFPTAYTVNLSSGGEPLLSRHKDKILDACGKYQVFLSLTTNGTLLKGNDFLKRIASVLHHIEISFDSSSPELFEALRSGASYKDILQNTKNLAKIRAALPTPRFNMGFSMTLFRENLEEIVDVMHIVSDVGGNFLRTDIGVVFNKADLHRSVLNCPELYNEI